MDTHNCISLEVISDQHQLDQITSLLKLITHFSDCVPIKINIESLAISRTLTIEKPIVFKSLCVAVGPDPNDLNELKQYRQRWFKQRRPLHYCSR